MYLDLLPQLPLELVELILEQLDNASLKTCSLVSSSFRPYAHRHLFRHLHLTAQASHRIVEPSFPIRSVNDVIHLTFSWNLISPYWLCKAQWLLPILKTLFNVESISLLGMSDSGPDWWNLPGVIQDALRALFQRPCLTRAVFQNISFDDFSQFDTLFQGSSLRDLSYCLSTSHHIEPFGNDAVQEVSEGTGTPLHLRSLAILVSAVQLNQTLTYLLLPNNTLRLNQLTVLTLRCTMYTLSEPTMVGLEQLLIATRSTLRHITFVHNRINQGASGYPPLNLPFDHLKSLHFTPTISILPFQHRMEFAIAVLSQIRRPCQLQRASLHLLSPSQRRITLSEIQQWVDKLWDSVNGMGSFRTMTLYLIPNDEFDPTILTQLSFPPGLRIESQLPSTLGFTFDVYSPL